MIELLKKNYSHLKSYNEKWFENCSASYLWFCTNRRLYGYSIVSIYGRGEFISSEARVGQNGLPEILCKRLSGEPGDRWYPVVDLIKSRPPKYSLDYNFNSQEWIVDIFLNKEGIEPETKLSVDCKVPGGKRWKPVFKEIGALYGKYLCDKTNIIQAIKNVRYQYNLYLNTVINEPECIIHNKVKDWLFSYLDSLVDDPCKDNYRCALASNRKQMKKYRKQKEGGCCGEADYKVHCPVDGKEYWVGCNYGH